MSQPLLENALAPDPIEQFRAWFTAAKEVIHDRPESMTLATSTPEGIVSARIVLLKGFDRDGFVFFTNYDSDKGRQLDANPHAALVFWWAPLDRQVRIEGTVEKVSEEESDAYFATRPHGSRIGAWASPQSRKLTNRDELENEARLVGERYPEVVPRPANWGGYRVIPAAIEFWQGQPDRLHDRFLFERKGEGWNVSRLAP